MRIFLSDTEGILIKKVSISTLQDTKSDDELFALLGGMLDRQFPNGREPTDKFVAELKAAPVGLRAMAATYELDVSLSLDDLGWHFGNWPNLSLARETARGLDELGATEMAAVFRAATTEAERHWKNVVSPKFSEWYDGSPLEQAIEPFNKKAWSLRKEPDNDLFALWMKYAREHPDRLFSEK